MSANTAEGIMNDRQQMKEKRKRAREVVAVVVCDHLALVLPEGVAVDLLILVTMPDPLE